MKVVGILGGMGPYASHAFAGKILAMTPAARDWDHVHFVLDSNPHIPSRTRYIVYGEQSPIPGMIDACLRLQRYPVDIIAIPCNSACAFLSDIRPHLSIPVMSVIAEAAAELDTLAPASALCAVLGGRVTFQTRSYESHIRGGGRRYLDHSENVQSTVEGLIEAIKQSPSARVEQDCNRFLASYVKQYRPDAVVLACTEFGCVRAKLSVPVVDSSTALARAVVARALSKDNA